MVRRKDAFPDAGVFKNWPSSNASLVDVTKVEELRVLKQTEVRLPQTC